ncbi:MJ0042-type zinc finger domain-containing protein [Roseibium sediminis]|uniref:MJ0042-type zinc finger domain-containing protein n=1 Tax=Roseibium sediminis TaxID=1775174 RepID=UPI00123CFE88|nr:MJ0042-type zinc finger domain-containing protein [Roseibium sediminis]
MKIKCPECRTSYDIKAEALGSEGRSVKCAKCGNRWFVSPSDEADKVDEPEEKVVADTDAWARDSIAEDTPAEDDNGYEDADDYTSNVEIPTPDMAAFEADTVAEETDVDPEPSGEGDEQPEGIEASAHRPKVKVNPEKFKKKRFQKVAQFTQSLNLKRVGSLSVLVGSILLCVMVVSFRSTIVRQAPDLASFFQMIGLEVNLRGLEFSDLRTFSEVDGGKQVLVVEGTIRNILDDTNQLPAIRLSIRGSDLREIYAWTVEPRTRVLNPRDETRFRTILTDPPSGATDIQVRFIDRDKRQLALE